MTTVTAVPNDLIRPRKKQESKNLFPTFNIKDRIKKYNFNKQWHYRNDDSSVVLLESLEVDSVVFQHYIFIEETKDLSDKLERIGFEVITEYPESKMFDKFSKMMYNAKHNVAFSLYKSQLSDIIQIANDITQESKFDGETGFISFVSTIKVLMDKQSVKSNRVRQN